MNERARKIEAELVHFFAEVVGVNVACVNGVAVIAVLPTRNTGRGVIPETHSAGSMAELVELADLAERIARL